MLRRIVSLGLVAAVFAAAPAFASDRVARALLDALRANGTIDAKQYEDLNQLIEDEAAAEAQAPAVAAPPPEKPGSLDVFWKNGLRLESADGAFKLKIGGRLHNDWGVVEPDDDLQNFFDDEGSNSGQGTGAKFRRARLAMSGTIWERTGYKVEFEFAGGGVQLTDTYLELLKLPVAGTLRVGHFKEPWSIDEQTSANNTVFVERALTRTFSPVRNTGFMLKNTALEERVQWGIGAFRGDSNNAGDGFSNEGIYNITGRVTGTPWYEDDGQRLLHLGISASHRFTDGEDFSFEQRPEVRLSNPNYVDTGDLRADGVALLGPELAVVVGPFTFQSEYAHAWVHGLEGGSDPDFWAVHAQAAWLLTGETRPYRPDEGAFDRVVPEHNFDLHGGYGAWEVALRYSRVDLDDAGIEGGTLNDGTVGLNWYLNPNVRTSFNYVLGRLEDVGWTNQFVARFQVDF